MQVNASVARVIHPDQGKLRQMRINLVGNALKFTTSGDVRVKMSADLAERAAIGSDGSLPSWTRIRALI